MAKVINIKKGLTINLKGEAERIVRSYIQSDRYTICPADLVGLVPKLAVHVGEKVLAGSPLFYDKNHPEVKVVSPVSGEVVEINRGAKRKILDVVVLSDQKQTFLEFATPGFQKQTDKEIKAHLSQAGLFSFIRQRPYDILANPTDTPRDIFISGILSAPLAPDAEFIIKKEQAAFETALAVLAKLTPGKVYLALRPTSSLAASKLPSNVEFVYFDGPHPVGNVSVHINHLQPINKGDVVWTISLLDTLYIGRLYQRSVVDLSRLVALTGSEAPTTGYYKMLPGASIHSLVKDKEAEKAAIRCISGDVLTGKRIAFDGSLAYLSHQITMIPEGNTRSHFLGWASLGLNNFSFSRTFLSSLLPSTSRKEFIFDARIKGGKRAIIMSNEYDRVFPLDILPEYLLKAIIAFDIDKMENLGIYEVAPEDFALCEFVDTSKLELQQIVREGLDLLYKEMN